MKTFNKKLNVRKNHQIYYIEEEIDLKNNNYQGFLKHDNVNIESVAVYSDRKLTGTKINSFALSIDSEFPWKIFINLSSSFHKVFITYETIGDMVEAEDINELQEAITETDSHLEKYKKDNTTEVQQLRTDINNLDNKKAEKIDIDTELSKRYLKSETYNKEEIANELNLKADKLKMQSELNNRYKKNEVYTKDETNIRIQNVIGTAPSALDTLKEISDALNNDANFASTMTKKISEKISKNDADNRYIQKSNVFTWGNLKGGS